VSIIIEARRGTVILSKPLEDYEDDLRGTFPGSLLRAALGHVLIGVLVAYALVTHPPHPPLPEDVAFFLGYPGRTHYAPDLEVLQAGSLRFSFYQPPQSGAAGGQRPADAKESHLVSDRPAAAARTQVRDRGAPARKTAPSPDGALASAAQPKAQTLHGVEGQGGVATSPGGVQPQALPGLQPDVPLSESLVIMRLVKPIYPQYELQHGVRGRVLISVRITPEGDVDDVVVRESKSEPADASTHGFELASLEALRQWRVHLPKEYQTSQGYWLTVPIEFVPEDQNFGKLEHLTLP
jgi:TonB family protein